MEIAVGITEARKDFSELVEKVQYRGDAYMINRHGKPAAVLVPVQIYDDWKNEREKLFSKIREMQTNSDLKFSDAENLAEEAISATRQKE